MNILVILIPLALLLAGIAVWAFLRACLGGQYEDLETPAYKALIDEPLERKK